MTDPDPFDEIVRKLDLDLPFPTSADVEPGPEPDDDQFYRRVEPRTPTRPNPRTFLAWIGVLSGPIVIMITTSLHVIMPRPLLLGAGLLFVASAVYLIAQLPERGPSEPWWPDDGAQV